MDKKNYGHQIETLGLKYLETQGLVLLKKNYRIRGGEIDLIFENSQEGGERELVFVEVRARCGSSYFHSKPWVNGVESVDWKKQRKLRRTIQHFLMCYRGKATSIRVDLLSWDGKEWEHLKNIWID